MTVLTVRLDDDLSAALTQRAADRGMTKAKLIRKLINDELALETMREDDAVMILDIAELTIIKDALETVLRENNTNDAVQLYFYVTRQLAELSVSLTSRPHVL